MERDCGQRPQGCGDQGLHSLCKCSDEIQNRAAHGEGPPKPARGQGEGVSSEGVITSDRGFWKVP